MTSRIRTTGVGSYPVLPWMVGNPSRLVLRDAVMAVLKTEELAGLDLVTDGDAVARSLVRQRTRWQVPGDADGESVLVHEALPELDLERIDTGLSLFGKRLVMPILISSMTGGTEEAGEINQRLAEAAQEVGVAMGVGSQRAARGPRRRSSHAGASPARGRPAR